MKDIVFLYPLYLFLLLAPLVFLVWGLWRKINRLPLFLSLAAVSLLVCASAFPVVWRKSSPVNAIIIDCSKSIKKQAFEDALEDAKKILLHNDNCKLYLVADKLEKSSPDKLRQAAYLLKNKHGDASKIAEAVTLAGAEITNNKGGRIIILSDGGETNSALAMICQNLSTRNIAVQLKDYSSIMKNEVILKSAVLSVSTGIGETAKIRLNIISSNKQKVEIKIWSKGEKNSCKSSSLEIDKGNNNYELPVRIIKAGLNEFKVELFSKDDYDLNNNSCLAVSFARPPYKILLLSKQIKEDKKALEKILNNAAEVMISSPGNLNSVALTVISGMTLRTIPKTLQLKLKKRLTDGMGLIVFSGRQCFNTEADKKQALAICLPVVFKGKSKELEPTTSLVFIIDTSGSMTGVRLALAKEVARLTMNRLRDCDKAGIVEFHGDRRWAAPLQGAANRLELQRALNRLSAGGGTVIMPAIQEAYYALRNSNSRLKHILVITDGGVEKGEFEELLNKITKHDITLSTVMVGVGRQSQFLNQLASWGLGRFYHASSRFNIPELSFRQSGKLPQPPYIEGKFKILTSSQKKIKIPVDLASIKGVLPCLPAKTAEILLTAGADSGYPLLSTWHYGLGICGIFASELQGDWVNEINNNPAYLAMQAGFMRQLTLNNTINKIFCLNKSSNLLMDLRFQTEDKSASCKILELQILENKKVIDKFNLVSNGYGKWNFCRFFSKPGNYIVKVKLAEKKDVFYFALRLAPAPEINQLKINAKLLKSLQQNNLKIPTPDFSIKMLDLRSICVITALALLFVQMFIRRLPVYRNIVVILAAFMIFFPAKASQITEAGAAISFAIDKKYDKALEKISSKCTYSDLNLKANILELAGQYSKAVNVWKHASETAPDRKAALYCRVRQFEGARKAEELDKLISKWLKLKDIDLPRIQLIADEMEEQHKFDTALMLLIEYTRKHKIKKLSTQYQIIRLAERCGKNDLVNKIYNKLIRNCPQNSNIVISLARFQLLNGEYEKALHTVNNGICRFTDSLELRNLAEQSANIVLLKPAFRALDKALKLEHKSSMEAVFFKSGILYKYGEADKAIDILDNTAKQYDKEITVLLKIANLYMRYGLEKKALVIYQKCFKNFKSDDAGIRAAMILESSGKLNAALKTWQELLGKAKTEARKSQAILRIIDLAGKTHKLELISNKIEKCADKALSLKQIKLLTTVYCKTKQFKKLTVLIQEQLKYSENKLKLHEIELRALLTSHQIGTAYRKLILLTKLFPENQIKYLQFKAVLAVETKNKKLASECIRQILDTAKDKALALESAAGIAGLMEDYPLAAKLYQKCLKLHPERIETWLSWGMAMKKMGKTDDAIQFYLKRAEKPKLEADEFGVMIDGVINMDAQADVLLKALKLTQKRLAENYDESFFYRLLEDLADNLNDKDLKYRLKYIVLAVDPDRQSQTLRQMFYEALNDKNTKSALSIGKILCSMSEILPLDVYLKMARKYLSDKKFAAAESILKQADPSEENYVQIQSLMADEYRDIGRLQDAGRIIKELIILSPNNIRLRSQYALLLELDRKIDAAGKQYFNALKIILDRQLSARKLSYRNRNISKFQNWYKPLSQAVLRCYGAASEKFRKELKDSLLNQIDPEHFTIKSKLYAELYRKMSLQSGDFEAIDKFDGYLLKVNNGKVQLRKNIIDSRIIYGLYDSAQNFMKAKKQPKSFVDKISELLICNQVDTARKQLLRALNTRQFGENIQQDKLLFFYCILLFDKSKADGVAWQWCNALLTLKTNAMLRSLKEALPCCWKYLKQEHRTAILEKLNSRHLYKYIKYPYIKLLLWQACVNGDISDSNTALFQGGLIKSRSSIETVIALIAHAKPEQRVDLLKQLYTTKKKSQIQNFTVQLINGFSFIPSEKIQNFLINRFEKNKSRSRLHLRWKRNPHVSALQYRLSERLLSEKPESLRIMVSAVIARNYNGKYQEAFELARDVIEKLGETTSVDFQINAFSKAVCKIFEANSLSEAKKREKDLKDLLAEIQDTRSIIGDSSVLSFIAACLNKKLNNTIAELACLKNAWMLESESITVLRILNKAYAKAGKFYDLNQILDFKRPTSPGGTFLYYRQKCACFMEMGKYKAVRKAAGKLRYTFNFFKTIAADFADNNTPLLRRDFLRFYIENRNLNRYSIPRGIIKSTQGGIVDFKENKVALRPSIITQIAEIPQIYNEFIYLLQGNSPNDKTNPLFLDAIYKAQVPEEYKEYYLKKAKNSNSWSSLSICAVLEQNKISAKSRKFIEKSLMNKQVESAMCHTLISLLPKKSRKGPVLKTIACLLAKGKVKKIKDFSTLLPCDHDFQLKIKSLQAVKDPFYAKLNSNNCKNILVSYISKWHTNNSRHLLPPWKNILNKMSQEKQKIFWFNISTALEKAHQFKLISTEQLLMHTAYLSTISGKSGHNKTSVKLLNLCRKNNTPNFAVSLWLVDAENFFNNKEMVKKLLLQLKKAKALPIARYKNILINSNNNPLKKGKTKCKQHP